MNSKPILLVEDNSGDIALTRRTFEKNRISNPLVVAEDGQKVLDYLSATGAHADRNVADLSAVALLDVKLLRADVRTRRLPVAVLTSSTEEQDLVSSYDLGVNSYIHKPVSFEQLAGVVEQPGRYWLVLSESPPELGRR